MQYSLQHSTAVAHPSIRRLNLKISTGKTQSLSFLPPDLSPTSLFTAGSMVVINDTYHSDNTRTIPKTGSNRHSNYVLAMYDAVMTHV